MVAFHNATIRRDKDTSPYQSFTGQDDQWALQDFRVFGCPVYVLHKCLQDGDHFNNWKARSWQGVYVGPSTCHASNIPLIYNPITTHVSPQFHVVYDEGFTSVTSLAMPSKDALLEKLYNKAYWILPLWTIPAINSLPFGRKPDYLLNQVTKGESDSMMVHPPQ
jgi:hypothetical protein